jgi:hypothetical protein
VVWTGERPNEPLKEPLLGQSPLPETKLKALVRTVCRPLVYTAALVLVTESEAGTLPLYRHSIPAKTKLKATPETKTSTALTSFGKPLGTLFCVMDQGLSAETRTALIVAPVQAETLAAVIEPILSPALTSIGPTLSVPVRTAVQE